MTMHILTSILSFQTLPAGPGRIFHVDFESELENDNVFEPESKIVEKQNSKQIKQLIIAFFLFVCVFLFV